ncbi:VWA domain-containing protein [Aquibacillus koreensis]|uniref:VWA domain-containing protein n=1 Tax=Aquibacillus koreensis TaxID=279446 RepID=A0A9X3WKS7_9BACI|nr:vWA domain-containing protein [Aquibacillus koreensis]MCT2536937.1 VWA domain-containing protein [Aquibacillus koreensis]MDC3421932.1 VWA domain-containing protein [Aquibacillus koreensis]
MSTEVTEIIFLLDRSGSMSGLEGDTIGGFNAFLKRQNELEGKTRLTTVLFDDQYEILWDGIEASMVRLTNAHYYVRGMTALLDAVGKTIVDVGYRLSRTIDQEKPSNVIFVITTDGLENASKEYNYEQVNRLISQKQEKDEWKFVFLGANMEAGMEANKLGISEKDAFDFEASMTGLSKMYETVNNIVCEKRLGE